MLTIPCTRYPDSSSQDFTVWELTQEDGHAYSTFCLELPSKYKDYNFIGTSLDQDADGNYKVAKPFYMLLLAVTFYNDKFNSTAKAKYQSNGLNSSSKPFLVPSFSSSSANGTAKINLTDEDGNYINLLTIDASYFSVELGLYFRESISASSETNCVWGGTWSGIPFKRVDPCVNASANYPKMNFYYNSTKPTLQSINFATS